MMNLRRDLHRVVWLGMSLVALGACLDAPTTETESVDVSTATAAVINCDTCIEVACGLPCCEQCGACTTLPCPLAPTPTCDADPATAIDALIDDRNYTGTTCTATSSTVLVDAYHTKECAQATVVYNPIPAPGRTTGCAHALSKAAGAVAIRNAWRNNAKTRGTLGAPTEDLVNDGGGHYYQDFDRGVLTRKAGASTAYYIGSWHASMGLALRTKWRAVRKASGNSPGGYPSANTRGVGFSNEGVGNPLASGSYIYVGPGGGAAYVVGNVVQEVYTTTSPWAPPTWYEAPGGWLGFPTSDQKTLVESGEEVGNNFEHGSVSGSVTTGVGYTSTDQLSSSGQVLNTNPNPSSPGRTIRFRLSGALVKPGCANDRDDDCLDQANENQLAFLAAPRIFWDEDESTSENTNAIHWKRLDLVQVRPSTPGSAPAVSTWVNDATWKRVVISYMMSYPIQLVGTLGNDHVGDNELIRVELTSRNLRDWYLDKVVYTHHGEASTETADRLAGLAADLGTTYLSVAADEDAHGSWPGESPGSSSCVGEGDAFYFDCFETDFAGSLQNGQYWWFNAGRNIGGPAPETFNTAGWPSPTTGPRLAENPINGVTHYVVYNDTGHGEAYEYISDPEPWKLTSVQADDEVATVNPETQVARAFCGWKCPVDAVRTVGGFCPDSAVIHEPYTFLPPFPPPPTPGFEPYGMDPSNYATEECDRGCFNFDGSTPLRHRDADACYELWGGTIRKPFNR